MNQKLKLGKQKVENMLAEGAMQYPCPWLYFIVFSFSSISLNDNKISAKVR